MPLAHRLQADAPSFTWKEPAGHETHDCRPVSLAYLPVVHPWHELCLTAEVAVPTGHARHATWPVSDWKEPTEHDEHWEVAFELLKVPRSHGEHAAWPSLAVADPGEQSAQAVLPVALAN